MPLLYYVFTFDQFMSMPNKLTSDSFVSLREYTIVVYYVIIYFIDSSIYWVNAENNTHIRRVTFFHLLNDLLYFNSFPLPFLVIFCSKLSSTRLSTSYVTLREKLFERHNLSFLRSKFFITVWSYWRNIQGTFYRNCIPLLKV